MRVLFVSPEIYPLMKTGGLGDVSSGLPAALDRLGLEVRLLMPGYPESLDKAVGRQVACALPDLMGAGPSRLIRARMPDTGLPVWLIDSPALFGRPGSPYTDAGQVDWPDNHRRFAYLARIGALLAQGAVVSSWRADVVHGNDWQSGLLPAYLAAASGHRPVSVFTIHNLAFQGLFPPETFGELGLPPEFYAIDGVEFWHKVSFMKAGLFYSDHLTTVSPTYAREIQTPEFGCGLEGLLAARSKVLTGVLNGVDYGAWDPSADAALAEPFKPTDAKGKARNKAALQAETGLARDPEAPLFVIVSRLTGQKGMDLVLGAAEGLLARGVQLAVLGTGEPELEERFKALAQAHPLQVAVRIGYDEAMAHRMMAGADSLLMPSRFEPCGLTQLYALRYGTLPLVRRVGGLADSVVDAGAIGAGTGSRPADGATGFQFDEASVAGLLSAIERALSLYRSPAEWRRVQLTGIAQDFSWQASADRYAGLYRRLAAVGNPAGNGAGKAVRPRKASPPKGEAGVDRSTQQKRKARP